MAKATRFGEAEYQEMFGPGGAGFAPDAVEFSNAAYDRTFSGAEGYPQRDPNAQPYRPPPPDPRDLVNSQFEQFKRRYKTTYKRLKRLHGNDVESFNRAVGELDADAEQYEAQHANTMAQIDYIQKLIGSGYDADSGLRAQQEVAGIRLPAEAQPRTSTPSATGTSLSQQMNDVSRLTKIMEEQLLHDPWYKWGGAMIQDKTTAETKLETLFIDLWDAQNLNDPRLIHKREGFIQSFKMAADNNEQIAKLLNKLLNKRTGSVEMRRRINANSSIIRAFNNRFSDTTPISSSIANQLPKLTSQPQTNDPLGIR